MYWLLFIILLLVIYLIYNRYEQFEGPLFSPLYVRLDSNNNALCISFQSPSANGVSGCTQVPCPSPYNNTRFSCYKCCNYD